VWGIRIGTWGVFRAVNVLLPTPVAPMTTQAHLQRTQASHSEALPRVSALL